MQTWQGGPLKKIFMTLVLFGITGVVAQEYMKDTIVSTEPEIYGTDKNIFLSNHVPDGLEMTPW